MKLTFPLAFENSDTGYKARAKINNPDASVGVVVLIRWLQSALIPFVTTQSVAEDGGY
ncbi:hypothetical protein [Treponema medium]|uniref:hypothetical protein n=1 Tax=Treponema medium TaxID=58231 RepID=UPI00198009D6|nr:hypothetical protein [Treponema medium]